MDLQNFDGAGLYFDEPRQPRVAALLDEASAQYATGTAEQPLLAAQALAPGDLSVLVGLYRFYYQHRHADALAIAAQVLQVVAPRLGLPCDWRALDTDCLARVAPGAIGLLRFHLLALKGAGYLSLRLGLFGEGKAMLSRSPSSMRTTASARACCSMFWRPTAPPFSPAATVEHAHERTSRRTEPGRALDEALEELVSAEDFLNFFGVPFVPSVVQVNRLHIMQRYHDYLCQAGDIEHLQDAVRYAVYRKLLIRAYEDFVASDAQTERSSRSSTCTSRRRPSCPSINCWADPREVSAMSLPLYEYGQAVRLIRNVRNDGTYPAGHRRPADAPRRGGLRLRRRHLPAGSADLPRAFPRSGLHGGLPRGGADSRVGPLDTQPVRVPRPGGRHPHLAVRGEVVVEQGRTGSIEGAARPAGGTQYHVYFGDGRVLQVPETSLAWADAQAGDEHEH